jgi:hypothetical protein
MGASLHGVPVVQTPITREYTTSAVPSEWSVSATEAVPAA